MTEQKTEETQSLVQLAHFRNEGFQRGRSAFTEALWLVVSAIFVQSPLPGSVLRKLLLRAFGAKIGIGVVIKQRVTVKFPWRLDVGDHSWIGEGVWIDNLDRVNLGDNVCISQGAYLCTGSHNWSSQEFDLITKPISVNDGAWICAKSNIGPGVNIGKGAVISMGATITGDVADMQIIKANGEQGLRKMTSDLS